MVKWLFDDRKRDIESAALGPYLMFVGPSVDGGFEWQVGRFHRQTGHFTTVASGVSIVVNGAKKRAEYEARQLAYKPRFMFNSSVTWRRPAPDFGVVAVTLAIGSATVSGWPIRLYIEKGRYDHPFYWVVTSAFGVTKYADGNASSLKDAKRDAERALRYLPPKSAPRDPKFMFNPTQSMLPFGKIEVEHRGSMQGPQKWLYRLYVRIDRNGALDERGGLYGPVKSAFATTRTRAYNAAMQEYNRLLKKRAGGDGGGKVKYLFNGDRPIDRSLVEYLRWLSEAVSKTAHRSGWKHDSMESFYLKEGRAFPDTPYTPEEEAVLLAVFRGSKPKIKECYLNAQRLATSNMETLKYAEGYVFSEKVPLAIHHAWVTINDKPVDVTLRGDVCNVTTSDPKKLLRRAKENLVRNAYYGVHFPAPVIIKVWHEEGTARPMVEPMVRESLKYLKEGM
jgi:hypothetical protein